MIGEVIQLFPLALLTLLAFWRPTWLRGTLFLLAGADSLIVGLTWRQAFLGAAGLGTSVVLFGFFVVLTVCFLKVLLNKNQAEDVEDEALRRFGGTRQ